MRERVKCNQAHRCSNAACEEREPHDRRSYIDLAGKHAYYCTEWTYCEDAPTNYVRCVKVKKNEQ